MFVADPLQPSVMGGCTSQLCSGGYRRRGTLRSGGEVRVSPAGLASWRSRAVKAVMISEASKARLRRPTETCRRTPAETSRVIA